MNQFWKELEKLGYNSWAQSGKMWVGGKCIQSTLTLHRPCAMTVLGTWESKMNVRPLLSSKFLGKLMERHPVVQPAPKSNHEGASTTLLRLNSREKQFILNWKSGSFRQRQWALHWAPRDKSGANRLRCSQGYRDLHESKCRRVKVQGYQQKRTGVGLWGLGSKFCA